MARLRVIVLVAVMLFVIMGSGAVAIGDAGEETGEYLVVLGRARIDNSIVGAVEEAGGEVVTKIPQIGVLVVRSSDTSFARSVAALRGVAAVGPDILWEMDAPVNVIALEEPVSEGVEDQGVEDNDLYLALQWDIKRVGGVPDTWDMETGVGAKVAVLDTGVYYSHPDIAPNYLYGKSYVVDHWHPDLGDVPGEDEKDYHGHGTHVAGSIAAPITAGRIIGVAPEVGIVNYKVLTKGGYGFASWIMRAIVDAADDGADVINLSLGGYRLIKDRDAAAAYVAYSRATQYASRQNALVVASSGNSALDLTKMRPEFHVPSGTSAALSINATGAGDELAFYSNYGASETRVVAPGGGDTDVPFSYCVSAYSPLGELEGAMYVWMAGTSMAAPKASGVAALLYAHNPGIRVSQVESILQQTADEAEDAGPGFDSQFGHGIVHAYRALTGDRR